MDSFKLKYITGHTILSNRPATMIFSGNSVKVVLEAHKDEPESILFDTPAANIQSYGYYDSKLKKVLENGTIANQAANNAQVAYIVDGKKYDFMSGDGTFSGNLSQVRKKMFELGAKVPDPAANILGNKPSKTNQIVFVSVVIVLFIAFIVYTQTHK